jgi:hypothetical protein
MRHRGALHRLRAAVGCGAGAAHPPAPRVALQKTLLRWCETSGTLSLPPLAWDEAEEDEAAAGDAHGAADAHAPNARRLRLAFRGSSAVSLASAPRAELAALEQRALEQRALRKVGFLFEAYTVQCWSWEVVELGRKLILTSILALVAPGSATQVTVGTLVAFCMLLLFQRLRPYAAPGMTFVASVAQVNHSFSYLPACCSRCASTATPPTAGCSTPSWAFCPSCLLRCRWRSKRRRTSSAWTATRSKTPWTRRKKMLWGQMKLRDGASAC